MRRLPVRFFPGVTLLAQVLALALALALGQNQAVAQAPALNHPLVRHDAQPGARQDAALQALSAKATAQRTRLAAINAELDRMDMEREAARNKAEALAQRSRAMLPLLWTLNLQARADREGGASTWDESDRSFAWLESVLAQIRQDIESARLARQELDRQQVRQEELRAQRDSQALALAATLSALLAESFTRMKANDPPRQDKTDPSQQYQRLLALLADFEFPALPGCPPLDSKKGTLPWPVQGRVVTSFAPPNSAAALPGGLSAPPGGAGASSGNATGLGRIHGLSLSEGIGLAVDGSAPVRAVHPGVLIFSDAVDGRGQVIILAHGKDALSIYSHLSLASQGVGQPVDTGETLGSPGPYPPARGLGMSFELRFQGKPFNPTEWLTAGQ